MRIPGPNATNKEWAVIIKLASQLKPPVETISLAHNKIASGLQLVSLPHYVPDLKNLSLQGNQIRQWKDMDAIAGKSKKLSQLRELVFLENPLREFEIGKNGVEKYRRSAASATGSSFQIDIAVLVK